MKNTSRLDYIENFKQFYSTVTRTSYDSTNNINLCQSKKSVIDFDEFKKNYLKEHELKGNDFSSVDAIAQYKKHKKRVVFIEFKNEKIDSNTVRHIKNKIKDSYLILLNIMGLTFEEAAEYFDLILVASNKKNSGRKHYDNMKNRIFIRAKKHFIDYGLEPFEGYMFKNVYTMTEVEFDSFANENL